MEQRYEDFNYEDFECPIGWPKQGGPIITLVSGKLYVIEYRNYQFNISKQVSQARYTTYLIRYTAYKMKGIPVLMYDVAAAKESPLNETLGWKGHYCSTDESTSIIPVTQEDLPLYVSWYCTPLYEELFNSKGN